MNKILRIGILGAGNIAEKLANTIAAMPDITVLAVASRSVMPMSAIRWMNEGMCF